MVRVTGEVRQAEGSEFSNEPYWYIHLRTAEILSTQPNPN
jgi:hypothetical protein